MAELVSLEELKLFCRVDADDDDSLLTALGMAAREFVEQATGRDYSSGGADMPERTKLVIQSLVAHWYEHREPSEQGQTARLPFHVRALLAQLRGGVLEPADEAAA